MLTRTVHLGVDGRDKQRHMNWSTMPLKFKVTCDDPDVVQNMTNVSPWQVQCVSLPEHSEVPSQLQRNVEFLWIQGFHSIEMENLFQGNVKFSRMLDYYLKEDGEVFPVAGSSLQSQAGSSQFSGISNFIHEHTHKSGSTYLVTNMSPIVEVISTEANAGNTQLSDLSADPPNDVQFFGNEVAGTRVCTASSKVGISSFPLFGKIIHMNYFVKPLEVVSRKPAMMVVECIRGREHVDNTHGFIFHHLFYKNYLYALVVSKVDFV